MLRDPYPVTYRWVGVDHVSPQLLAAVIAHEDPAFLLREGGTDWHRLLKRALAFHSDGHHPGASVVRP